MNPSIPWCPDATADKESGCLRARLRRLLGPPRVPVARTPRRDRSGRRGVVIQEAFITILIASAVVVGAAQLLSSVAHQRRSAAQRDVALREAANVMEIAMAHPWQDVTSENLSETVPSANAQQYLPEVQIDARVDVEGDGGDAKRITICVDWRLTENQQVRPVQLVAWRYRQREAAP